MPSPETSVEVLHVPGCPNLAVLLENLRAVTDLPITTREISADADVPTAGMHGSPTVLINSRDPFTPSGGVRALSCRIYRDEHGHPIPAPSRAQLRDAFAAALGKHRCG